jgi:hypothetical protein
LDSLKNTFDEAALATPEPGTFALLGVALAGVGLVARKRKS